MQLNDPVCKESAPTAGGDSFPPPGPLFTPAPISPTTMAFLRWSLERRQQRRRKFRARHLRVCIDGEEGLRFDPGRGVCGPFRVPLSTWLIEIYGDDDDGELLLAMFPLPAPAVVEDDRAQELFVTLEGGQTIGMDITLGNQTCGEMSEYVIQIAYSISAEVDTLGAENPTAEAIAASGA